MITIPNYKRGLSIDVGIHNMAFYVEEFDLTALAKIESVPIKKRLTKNREATPEYQKFLDQVRYIGKRKYCAKVDLSTTKGTKFNLQTFITLSAFLDQKKEQWEKCDFVIIEQQVKANFMAQRLEQHIISWFTINYLDTIPLVIYPARHKYFSLGCPMRVTDLKTKKERKIKPAERKKWASVEALKILEARKDKTGIAYLTNKVKKNDDVCDCLIQLISFMIKCFIDKEYQLYH